MLGEYQYHVHLNHGDVGRYILLPGDPGRCKTIAAYLDNSRFVSSNREFTTYTGELNGEKVSVVSTGIGGPSAAIAMEELIKVGADTFVRVGTCGGMNREVTGGDLVIATAAVRAEGTSREYLPLEYPAAANFEVVCALNQAAKQSGYRHHVGVVQCKDSFYGQHAPETMPVADELLYKWNAWIAGGCLASEMESAAVFSVAAVRSVRAGTVLLAIMNKDRRKLGLPDEECYDIDRVIRVGVDAVKRLIEQDRGQMQPK